LQAKGMVSGVAHVTAWSLCFKHASSSAASLLVLRHRLLFHVRCLI
jgi:hypothetical protein